MSTNNVADDDLAILMSVTPEEYAAVVLPSEDERRETFEAARRAREAAEIDLPQPVVTEHIRIR